MKIQKAEFIKSAPDITHCPESSLPEYAFCGRSNVGKSSLINMLTNHKKLAVTSSKPGRTRLINLFLIDDHWQIADLPGYGYAKVSKSERESWKKMVNQYLLIRQNLVSVFVLLDSRHEPQKNDLSFMQFLGENGIPFVMTFTKIDKLKNSEWAANLKQYQSEMLKTWEELPPILETSSEKGTGQSEVLQYIQENNSVFTSQR